MKQRAQNSRPASRASISASALFVLAGALAGCVGGGAQMSAFVDPAKYLSYDCKQLETARKPVFQRVSELQGLMAKAEQGAAGALVSGLAYQTEYLSARDNLALIDETRRQNNCPDVAIAPDETPGAPKTDPPPRGRKKSK